MSTNIQASVRHLRNYASAALINTAAGLLIIYLLYHCTASPIITISISTLLGYAYSLATYHTIAFPGKRRAPPFLKYSFIYSLSICINSGLTYAVMSMTSSFWIGQLIALPIAIIFQWLGLNLWAFR